MKRLLFTLAWVSLAPVCQAQETASRIATDRSAWAPFFGFAAVPAAGIPGGWGGGPPISVFADDQIVHRGPWSGRLERRAGGSGGSSSLTHPLPMNFSGAPIERRRFLPTAGVSHFAGLWRREEGGRPGLARDPLPSRRRDGTTTRTECSRRTAIQTAARQLFLGALPVGRRRAGADPLPLLADARVWQAPAVDGPKTALDADHEFDGGSGIVVHGLKPVQIENLVILGKAWGFLKYHHPQITAGQRHWDYDLFRILPAILAAPDRPTANAGLRHWIESLGSIAPCNPCAKLEESDLDLRPDLNWTRDPALLGADLSASLRSIHENRTPSQQFYLSKVSDAGNPSFHHELGYENLKFPDAGFQLLALYRFWNIIEYWSPDRDVVGEDWNRVLAEFIPRIALAPTAEAYQRELMALVGKAHDGHANLWASLDARPPVGNCELPLKVRFIESLPVIAGFADSTPPQGLKIGDVVTELDGTPVSKLVEQWLPYYAASNDAARMRDIARYMTRGACQASSISVRRNHQEFQFKIKRVPYVKADTTIIPHDLPGPTFRLFSKDVAYLKLSSVKDADAVHYIEQAAGTKGMVVDIRNYPSEFMVFALGSMFVEKPTTFARFTEADLSNPGAFHWTETDSISPKTPHYAGKIVILVDESSMSQAEYTAMAFRSAPNAIVVGSTTAGADGNVSPFALPGDLRTMISGIGVFYPDKTPTQRIGILPNVEVHPTIAGIRAGRDEVLEEALRQIIGRDVPAAEIETMAKP